MSSKTKKAISKRELHKLTGLFERASRLSPSQRKLFLRKQRSQDPDLARELRNLLDSENALDGFLDRAPRLRLSGLFDEVKQLEELQTGTRIGDFRIERILGSGSFATVYLATELSLGREVALKITSGGTDEARTIAALNHRSIVQVYSEHIDPGSRLRFICMSYVKGASLDRLCSLLRQKALPLNGRQILRALDEMGGPSTFYNAEEMKSREAMKALDEIDILLTFGIQLCEALSFAHSRGILHLDVKPGNILINHCGVPMLSDFNIAVRKANGGAIPEQFGGTPEYMSPEQQAVFQSQDKFDAFTHIDPRSDLFSLGKVLEELLSLSGAGSIRSQSATNLVTNLKMAADLSPQRRFASASEFGQALQNCAELRAIERRLSPRSPRLRFIGRHPLLWLTIVGALPQVLAAAVGTTYNSIEIVSHLGPEQRDWYGDINVTYTVGSYALTAIVWAFALARIYPFVKDPARFRNDHSSIEKWRRHAANLPLWGMLCSALGWLPGTFLYPLLLQLHGPLPAPLFVHFIASFSLSWLIALSYSYVIQQYFVLRDLYPRFSIGTSDDRELRKTIIPLAADRTRTCLALTMLAPLSAAFLTVLFGSDSPLAQEIPSLRWLVASLIALGVAGVFFSALAGPYFVRCLSCFRVDITKPNDGDVPPAQSRPEVS